MAAQRSPYKSSREGYVSDLSFRERTKLRAQYRGGQAKSFLGKHGLLIGASMAAVVLLYFRKELKEQIGADAAHRLTP